MRAIIALMTVMVIAASAPAALADDTDANTPSAATLDDAAFDAQFQCPETLGDRDSRLEEIQRYQSWARDHHPDWNLKKRLDVRYGLLRRHACAVTLANVAASAKPPF